MLCLHLRRPAEFEQQQQQQEAPGGDVSQQLEGECWPACASRPLGPAPAPAAACPASTSLTRDHPPPPGAPPVWLAGLELGKGGESRAKGSGSDSDDSLPPIQRINNRRVIEYEVSESESDEE